MSSPEKPQSPDGSSGPEPAPNSIPTKVDSDSDRHVDDDVHKGLLRLEDGTELEAQLFTDQVIFRAYSGPLPEASDLDEYNLVVKDGAERIVQQFEAEGESGRQLRGQLTNAHIRSRERAQWMAFISGLSCFGLAAFAIYMNQPWVAALFGAATFGNIVLGLLRDGGVELPVLRRGKGNGDG